MARRASRLIQVDDAVTQLVFSLSFIRLKTAVWIRPVLSFNEQLALSFPRSNSSRHDESTFFQNRERLGNIRI
jgi:hypothetical protein